MSRAEPYIALVRDAGRVYVRDLKKTMIAGRHFDDYDPIAWAGRVPIYATTLLVALHVLTMFGCAVAMAAGGMAFAGMVSAVGLPAAAACPWLTPLVFSSAAVLQHFSVWQFITYAFVNEPSIWFAIEMWLLYTFGREVEKFIGRRAFLLLYASLLLAGPIALTALNLAGAPPMALCGSSPIHFAIFIAFVVIYPGAQIFFSLQAKWVAAILLGIYSLQYLAFKMWIPLGVLWLLCGCAVLMLRGCGVSNVSFGSWLPRRRESAPKRQNRRRETPPANVYESIDPLLEKISRQGIGSLTKHERQRLEDARVTLLEQEKHSHR